MALMSASASASANPGALDRSFGVGGRLTTPVASSDDVGGGLALQRSGRIVVAGVAAAEDGGLLVTRLFPDGTTDEDFGSDGFELVPIALTDDAATVALGRGGSIVVAGGAFTADGMDAVALAKFTSNGAPDSAFGVDGLSVVSKARTLLVNDVMVERSGRILVAACLNDRFTVLGFTGRGQPDATFGRGGRVTTSGPGGCANDLARDRRGRIVAAGTAASGEAFCVVRLLPDGRVDRAFGVRGRASIRFERGRQPAVAMAVSMGRRGTIVIGGGARRMEDGVMAVARLTSRGNPDRSFAGDGRRLLNVGAFSDVSDIAVQRNNKIVLTGAGWGGDHRGYDFAVARLSGNGRLDRSFARRGKVLTQISKGSDVPAAVAIQPNGRILVSGQSLPSPAVTTFSLARYQGDPAR